MNELVLIALGAAAVAGLTYWAANILQRLYAAFRTEAAREFRD